MVLLALEGAELFGHLSKAAEGGWLQVLMEQLEHHPWHGLHAWDLVQPAFMFMAGAAMAYSLDRQRREGMSWAASFRKTLQRCGWLFFWGVLDYAVKKNGLFILLWDVLTQLSFTTLVAFLVFRWSYMARILVCIGLLLLTEILYRYTHVPGFDQPFTDQHNFGNYVDLLLMNTINRGGWVAINCIPTAVHTIAGTMAGQLMLGMNRGGISPAGRPGAAPALTPNDGQAALSPVATSQKKIRSLLLWGGICLLAGFGLDWAGVTPIIKKIATSTFTLASLGWCLWLLAVCYWWIDMKGHRKGLRFFTIVGMNSIFIYLFFEIVGSRWFNDYITAIVTGLLKIVHTPTLPALIVSSLVIFALEWGICYFLYKKKIFFRV